MLPLFLLYILPALATALPDGTALGGRARLTLPAALLPGRAFGGFGLAFETLPTALLPARALGGPVGGPLPAPGLGGLLELVFGLGGLHAPVRILGGLPPLVLALGGLPEVVGW